MGQLEGVGPAAIDLAPDGVTVYQMELPYNTVYSQKQMQGQSSGVADWDTKRAWHEYAFEQLEQAGYVVSSAYTVVRPERSRGFVYRDSVWRGCDLLGLGVSSFGHVSGLHYQNSPGWAPYLEQLDAGNLPLDRAFAPDADERLTREVILQLKLGRLDPAYFRDKFGVEITERFAPAFERLRRRGFVEDGDDPIRLTRSGLYRVDTLLPEFYAECYQNARYT